MIHPLALLFLGMSALCFILLLGACAAAGRADEREWRQELENDWPQMPEHLDGVDLYAEYPIAGMPQSEILRHGGTYEQPPFPFA